MMVKTEVPLGGKEPGLMTGPITLQAHRVPSSAAGSQALALDGVGFIPDLPGAAVLAERQREVF